MPILRPEERLDTIVAGKYRLDSILGRGGVGVVFKGEHEVTERPVAVKLLLPSFSDEEGISRRFVQEAKTAASLHHPNVVDVLDMGETSDGALYVALEFLEGESLADRLERCGKLTPLELLDALVPIVDALAMAHERGITHRDIKPDNIFLSVDGRGTTIPKVLDFGIAKLAEGSSLKTNTGALIGTPQYMSPEQASADREIDAASDVWALGVVFYECLAGRRPFEAESITALLLQLVTFEPTPLAELAPGCPPALLDLVERCLAKDRGGRPATARELLPMLEDARSQAGEGAGAAELGDRPAAVTAARTPVADADNTDFVAPRARPSGALVAVGVAVAIALGGIGLYSWEVASEDGVPPPITAARAADEGEGDEESAPTQAAAASVQAPDAGIAGGPLAQGVDPPAPAPEPETDEPPAPPPPPRSRRRRASAPADEPAPTPPATSRRGVSAIPTDPGF